MRAGWYVAIATGLAIGMAPAAADAQRGPARGAEARERGAQSRPPSAERQRAAERERQQRANERDRYNDRYNERDRYEYDRRQQQQRGQGPAFCRSGAGHPVHGRQWCRDKGWGLGTDRGAVYDRRDSRDGTIWDRDSRDRDARYPDPRYPDPRDRDRSSGDVWGDIILGQPRGFDSVLDRRALGDIFGASMISRLETFGRQFGAGALTGRWVQDSRANVLQLSLGSTPFARLIDTNRDGRIDDVALRR